MKCCLSNILGFSVKFLCFVQVFCTSLGKCLAISGHGQMKFETPGFV